MVFLILASLPPHHRICTHDRDSTTQGDAPSDSLLLLNEEPGEEDHEKDRQAVDGDHLHNFPSLDSGPEEECGDEVRHCSKEHGEQASGIPAPGAAFFVKGNDGGQKQSRRAGGHSDPHRG